MLLKELKLIGFGKFKNKNIELKDGINLIYGENEAGKSTIHSFIDGIFYGFLRPGARSALYLEEHEKYNPWDNSRYAGVIRFRYKDKDYRIEREFSKGKESTKVIDENTGVDITKDIDTGSNRILQPGIHFFGFNTRVFTNTLSVKQLASKTEDKLASEVTEKLINVSTSLDDNISVDRAILDLKNSMAEIGTDRAPTKPYAQNLKALQYLETERKEILSEKEQYNRYLEEEDRLKDLLAIDEDKLSKAKDDLRKAQLYKKARKLQEAEILTDEIGMLREKSNALLPYSNLSMENYREAINLSNSIEYINEDIEENTRELHNLEGKDKSLDYVKEDYKDWDSKLDKYKRNRLLFIILTIISLGIGIVAFTSNRFIPLIGLFPVFGIIAGYYSGKVAKGNTNVLDLQKEIRNLESREIEKKNVLTNKLENFKVQREEKIRRLENIFKENDVRSLEEFNEGLNKKSKYESSVNELESKKQILVQVLGEDSLEGLKDEINKSNITIIRELGNLDENQIRYEIDRYMENITDNKIALKGVEENLNIIEKDISRLVDIEEDILRKTAIKEDQELKYKSLQLAADTIEDLSKDIHSQFAPRLNKKVGKVIDKISNGKYTKIKISESLDINVENPTTGEIVHIDSLSGGTIDQLYFALRFGIIDSIVEENLPLILDDCFIQYDDKRLTNIIEFLEDLSKERQIILFTCHKREQRVLDELALDYNLINLT